MDNPQSGKAPMKPGKELPKQNQKSNVDKARKPASESGVLKTGVHKEKL